MRLLVDTDAFCKLALADLLSDVAGIFGADLRECGRLPALRYMLRRGSLPRAYGGAACERLIPIAERMPVLGAASGPWLERLAPVPEIDPGEAILFAAAAERRLPIVTSDLRALRALANLEGFPEALTGQIVVIEAALLALCRTLGSELVRSRSEPVRPIDTVIGICFSPDNREPEEGLDSYLRERKRELAPLVLWEPGEETD